MSISLNECISLFLASSLHSFVFPMDQLERLSIKELLDLNAAVQEELAKRIQELTEENIKCRTGLSLQTSSAPGFTHDPGQS